MFIGFINVLISASSRFVCGFVAIAIVNLVLFPVLTVSLCLVVHRFHKCMHLLVLFVGWWP